MNEILRVVLMAALSYAALLIIALVLGKKQIAQLEFIDYVAGITIGSIAAEMAFSGDVPFYHFLIAMAVYFVVDIAISFLTGKSIVLRTLLKGKPLILIEDGSLNYKNLKKSRMELSELLALCRQKDMFDISQIAFCVFETNGQLSILPKASFQPLQTGDMDVQKPKPSLSTEMVLDGQIIYAALKEKNKSKQWLLEQLGFESEEQVKQVAIASYNDSDKSLYVSHM